MGSGFGKSAKWRNVSWRGDRDEAENSWLPQAAEDAKRGDKGNREGGAAAVLIMLSAIVETK